MALTSQQQQSIIKAIQAKGVNNTCPICKTMSVNVLDYFAGVFISDQVSGPFNLGPVMRGALSKCDNCGNLQIFDLDTLGVPIS